MTTDCPHIPEHMSLAQLVDDYVLSTGRRCFLITRNSHLLGLITVHQIKCVPRTAWAHTTVCEAMIPLEGLRYVAPEAEVSEVLTLMDEEDIGQVPVLKEGQLLGMIGRDHLLRIIRAHVELRA